MKNRKFIYIVIVLLFAVVFNVSGITIKLASIAPEQSPWGDALNKMASDWARISNGRINVRVYHNAVAGDESDMLRKMKIGQLQAGVFTSFGLNKIAPEILALSVPLLIQNNEELQYVLENVKPILEQRIERERFKAIAWSIAGWVRFFSKEPVYSPQSLMKMKMAANPSEHELLQTWKILGFRPIPVSVTEVLTALNSGMVDALYNSPLVVAGYQWFGVADNMLDLKITPFIGSIIIDERTWRRIPDNLKPELRANLEEVERRLDNNILELEQESIELMESYGLTINTLTSAQAEEWNDVFSDGIEMTLGTVFDREMVETIQDLLQDVR